ncbi:MAG: VWA domain-containing protein [Oleispira sp.]|nr:VWA domain-containing protein [Oleispira sp.]
MFEFENIWAFLLLPLPFLVYWLAPAYQESQDSLRVPFFKRLLSITGQQPQKGAVILQRVFFQKIWGPISWLLVIVSLAKPMMIAEPIEQVKSARDLLVAVDLSGSMEVADFKADDGTIISRLAAVKLVLAEFSAQRKHDRLGLIVFADAPYLQAPFTEDHKTWLTLLNETEIGMAGQSTLFGDAIGLGIKLFEKSDSKNKVLIILTDGNDTGSRVPPIEAAKVAAKKGLTIYTIAIGDPETAGEEALDLKVLASIAKITSGAAYQAFNKQELDNIYQEIAKLEPDEYETLSYRPKISLHHYPLAIALLGYILFFVVMTGLSLRRQPIKSQQEEQI